MKQVTLLRLSEPARLDIGKLEELYDEMGEVAADNALCRAMEELALKLTETESCMRGADWQALAKLGRMIAAVAEPIGMTELGRIALSMRGCVEAGDRIALAAVHQRLLRAGEAALTEIWQAQDMTI